LTALLLSGCASRPEAIHSPRSHAFDAYETTGLGQLFEPPLPARPGESGFALLRKGEEAFTARVALTELAQRTLDFQYYIWEADATGRILAQRLERAADRGVRVRILLDDNNMVHDSAVGALALHENIEIRTFNPFVHRKAKMLDFAVNLSRVNHRMHNKLAVADNAIAIVGGRNISDHYFGVDKGATFRDLDVVAVGPIVRDTSRVFDEFWNGPWALPIAAISREQVTQADYAEGRERLQEAVEAADYPYPLDADIESITDYLAEIRDRFTWAPARVFWDDPRSLGQEGEGEVMDDLRRELAGAQREILIESAYFVPRDGGVEIVREARNRGVRLRVLTNSLSSNDVAAAHGGYAKTRVALLQTGVELHELRADSRELAERTTVTGGHSRAGLHTKALVIDRRHSFIGSFNLDPRSARINTEVGILIDSPSFAALVVEYLDEGIRPENSYRVTLDERGALTWTTRNGDEVATFDREPEAGFWKRLTAKIVEWLPVDSQL